VTIRVIVACFPSERFTDLVRGCADADIEAATCFIEGHEAALKYC